MRLSPANHNTDGFFAAVLVRTQTAVAPKPVSDDDDE